VKELVATEKPDDAAHTYYQWNATNNKVLIESTIQEAVEELIDQLAALKKHCFIAKVQLQQIKQLKSSLTVEEAVIHEDFSENFVIKQQDEIMSAHWISEGVTLFTAIVTKSTSSDSYVVVSNELSHDKYSVHCYNQAILKHANANSEIKHLHMFSDGAGSQFKNRFSLSVLLDPKQLHPKLERMDWSFFGTAHGKGPVDGIGGTVKRTVWRRILQRRAIITSAEEFARIAEENCPSIIILYVPKETVEEVKKTLENKWNKHMPRQIPGTHALHYAVATSPSQLLVKSVSPFSSIITDNKIISLIELEEPVKTEKL